MSKVTAIALANDYSSLLNLLETSDELDAGNDRRHLGRD